VKLLNVEGNNVKTILCRGKRGAAATCLRENINTAIILRENNERADVGFKSVPEIKKEKWIF